MTEKASIAGRSLFVTLLALALALVFVVTLAGDADARRVRHKKSTAAFVDCVDGGPGPCDDPQRTGGVSKPFTPPDRFTCRYLDVGVPVDPAQGDAPSLDGYRCEGGTTTFLLNDVLTRNGNPPPGEGPLDGVAVPPPDLFQCRSDGTSVPPDYEGRGADLADHFNCQSRENQQTFKVNEIVSTTLDEEDSDPPVDNVDDKGDVFLPPGPHTTTPTPTPKPTPKPTATKTPAAVPTAVPAGTDAAGTDAAGGGSAAGLVGLVLAAGGAVAGGAVMARRRFMHDS